MVELKIKVAVAVPTPAFLPVVFVVPIPTEDPVITVFESAFLVTVNIPVTTAPELFACTFTFPSVCLILVASIPVKFAPLIAGNVPVRFAAGIEVKFAPLPENDDAVTIPVNVASPCCLIVTPTPVPVPKSIPVECNKESPIRIDHPGSVPIPTGEIFVNAI